MAKSLRRILLQYYDRNSFAVPKNFDFTKYTRINFAFFQTNADGDIWGTDEWAGKCSVVLV
jgi:GH18 family chitinase